MTIKELNNQVYNQVRNQVENQVGNQVWIDAHMEHRGYYHHR
jgi:hypothetical protein